MPFEGRDVCVSLQCGIRVYAQLLILVPAVPLPLRNRSSSLRVNLWCLCVCAAAHPGACGPAHVRHVEE